MDDERVHQQKFREEHRGEGESMKRLWRRLLPQVPGGRVPQYIAPRPQPRPSLLSTQDTQKQPTKREGACCVCRGKEICTAALCVSMGERRDALPHTFATACAVCAKSERNMPQVTHRRPDPDWLGLAHNKGRVLARLLLSGVAALLPAVTSI